jgi:hypothetical protein
MPTKASDRVRSRLSIVASVIQQCTYAPTHANLLERLRQLGVKTSKGTLVNDLNALGFTSAASAYQFRHGERSTQ